MRILRAEHLGMCFGVRDAIDLARDNAAAAPLTILGDLVHNPSVLATLRAEGIAIAQQAAEVRTGTVMITAHGASNRTLAGARALGLTVVEATCPLVAVAHRALAALVQEGYHPVVIGMRAHVEVRGLTEDLADVDVILEEGDVLDLNEHPRIGIVAQTTQPVDRVRLLVALVRGRFPRSDVRFIDTVCKPTKQRQEAAVDLARRSTVVVVVGGATSNNTRELVATCSRHCGRVHHIRTDSDLQAEWFEDQDVVGITAGTSTPDDVIDAVEERIQEFAKTRGAFASCTAQTPPAERA